MKSEKIKLRLARMEAMRGEGLTIGQISVLLDVSTETVRRDIRSVGLRVDARQNPSTPAPPIPELKTPRVNRIERRQLAKEMYLDGLSANQIADVLGGRDHSIYESLSAEGVVVSDRGAVATARWLEKLSGIPNEKIVRTKYLTEPARDLQWRYEVCKDESVFVLLLSTNGCYTVGKWYGELDQFFHAWCPLPRARMP